MKRLAQYKPLIGALLYLTGFLDSRMPRDRFIAEVLDAVQTPETLRLARNHLEASFDMIAMEDCRLLLHESLAQPEQLVRTLSAYGAAALVVSAALGYYSRLIFRRSKPAIVEFIAMLAAYGAVFVMLQLETYALLTGSAALFILLLVLMTLTGNLNRREAEK